MSPRKEHTTAEMIAILDGVLVKYGAKIPDERLVEIEQERAEAREKRKQHV